MSGWVTIQYYLREIVIYLVAVIFLECAFNFPYFIYFLHSPPALVSAFFGHDSDIIYRPCRDHVEFHEVCPLWLLEVASPCTDKVGGF